MSLEKYLDHECVTLKPGCYNIELRFLRRGGAPVQCILNNEHKKNSEAFSQFYFIGGQGFNKYKQ